MATDVEKQTNQLEDEMEDQDPPDPGAAQQPKRILVKALKVAIFIAFVVPLAGAFLTLLVVVCPILSIIILSLPEKLTRKIFPDDKREVNGDDEDEIASMYNQSRRQETLWKRIMQSSLAVLARISFVMLVWLALSLFVPRLKEVALLGSPMWKWSLLAVTLTAGYSQTGICLLPLLLVVIKIGKMDDFYYFEAMFPSVINVGYFGMVLVSWLAYFSTDQGLKQASTPHPQAFDYVTWSLVSLFVGSLLWIFKTFLMAKWRADAIYRRFEPRIFITSLKFLFIGLCAAGFYEPIMVENVLDGFTSTNEEDQNGDAKPAPNPKRFGATLHKMSGKMSVIQLFYVARILTSLVEIMSPLLDGDDEEEEVVSWFQKKIKPITPGDTCTPDSLLQLFHSLYDEEAGPTELPGGPAELPAGPAELPGGPAELPAGPAELPAGPANSFIGEKEMEEQKLAKVLFGLVREECSSPHFTFHDLKIWMVDAHKDCTNMGRTLADASAMVNRLDLFMSCVIIVIVLLLWLLLTGVSSTTVLVTVATPFLALTFVFGDTAKTFFQGLVFCFGTHPFDVGDRCVLDETQLEVKSVSILTTTFMKIGSKEKRLYPNSILATKAIVNLGWQPDPRDVIVLTLDSFTNIESLEAQIKEFFTMEKSRFNDQWELVVKEVGDYKKVEIHFTHELTVHDLSHHQCFEKKNKQKSYFLKRIEIYIKEARKEQVNSSNFTQLPINEIEESED